MSVTVKAAHLPGSGGGFTMGVWRAEDVPVGSDVGMVSASAPKVQMTDAEIDTLWAETLTTNPLPQPAYRHLARAILARSAPNAELVTVIRKAQGILGNHLPPDGPDCKSTISALLQLLDGPESRAALAAVGEA